MPEQLVAGRLLRRGVIVMWRQVRLRPIPFLIAVGGALVYALGIVGQSWVLGQVIDRVVVPRFASGHLAVGATIAAACAIVAVGLAKTAGIICRRVAATVAGAGVEATLRERLAGQYLWLPLEYHHRHPAGELLSHTEGDLKAAAEVLHPLPFATGVIALLLAAATWLVLTDPYLAAIGLIVVPLTLLVNLVYQRRVEHWTTLAQQRLGEVSSIAHESFDGALVVKALGVERAEGDRFARGAELLRDARVRIARTRATFDAALDAVPALLTMVLLAPHRRDPGRAGQPVRHDDLAAAPDHLCARRHAAGGGRLRPCQPRADPAAPARARRGSPAATRTAPARGGRGGLRLRLRRRGAQGHLPAARGGWDGRAGRSHRLGQVHPDAAARRGASGRRRRRPPGRRRSARAARRQRVALARALARRPRLLVLDEATSSVDPVTEAAILAELRRALPATTTVIVASRLATIALAGRVLYMEAGRLVAEGTHQELLAGVPGYAKLARAYQRAEAAGGEEVSA